MRNYFLLLGTLVASLLISGVQADTAGCPVKLNKANFFPAVQTATEKYLNEQRCPDLPAANKLSFPKYLDTIRWWFDPYGGFVDGASPIKYIEREMSTSTELSFSTKVDGGGDQVRYLIDVGTFIPANINQCRRVSDAECHEVLEEFDGYYRKAHMAVTSNQVEQVRKTITQLRKEWEPFLNEIRSQTYLEQAVNGWWYRRAVDEQFQPPPNMQWILLHPIALIEYVDEAGDGDQMNAAVGLELFGANWWKKKEWYVPTGGSLLTLYSDRAGSDDIGYGIAVHFDSDYTIGVTQHGDDTGFFLSVDLLKAFHDKKAVFDSYIK